MATAKTHVTIRFSDRQINMHLRSDVWEEFKKLSHSKGEPASVRLVRLMEMDLRSHGIETDEWFKQFKAEHNERLSRAHDN